MGYIEGFVVAVPAANKDSYVAMASRFAPLFREFGATRLVEAWGDDVPDGKVTDFKGAVKATPDEVVVFAWLEYPSKEARDAANVKLRSDPRMEPAGDHMPFDAKRMIFGGFAVLHDEKSAGKAGYVDGCLIPVPAANKQAYADMATQMAAVFRDHGAVRVVEAWADDVPDGTITDFKGAVKATPDEKVVYSWIEWPSKAVRDEGWKKVMADPRAQGGAMPFDGKRMIYGGFAPVVDA
ncbi:DUF1428 domain-containing protein [Reyranella sp.]|uniref:DUF1428 domain-containing protein n=1 Tax=Reyranella sp. TaxID=1929291 RepID=UPI003BA9C3DE